MYPNAHASLRKGGKPAGRHPRGFTLVELQIGLVLVAMIGVLIIGVLKIATQTWSRVAEQREQTERHFLVIQALRRQLGDMRFPKLHTDKGQLIGALGGGGESIQFVAPFPTYENSGELYWWTLTSAAEDAVETTRLQLRYQKFNQDDLYTLSRSGDLELPEESAKVLILADDLALVAVRFFAAGKRAGGWLDEWRDRDDAPLAIGLTLEIRDADGNAQPLPEVVVNTRFSGLDEPPPASETIQSGGAN